MDWSAVISKGQLKHCPSPYNHCTFFFHANVSTAHEHHSSNISVFIMRVYRVREYDDIWGLVYQGKCRGTAKVCVWSIKCAYQYSSLLYHYEYFFDSIFWILFHHLHPDIHLLHGRTIRHQSIYRWCECPVRSAFPAHRNLLDRPDVPGDLLAPKHSHWVLRYEKGRRKDARCAYADARQLTGRCADVWRKRLDVLQLAGGSVLRSELELVKLGGGQSADVQEQSISNHEQPLSARVEDVCSRRGRSKDGHDRWIIDSPDRSRE